MGLTTKADSTSPSPKAESQSGEGSETATESKSQSSLSVHLLRAQDDSGAGRVGDYATEPEVETESTTTATTQETGNLPSISSPQLASSGQESSIISKSKSDGATGKGRKGQKGKSADLEHEKDHASITEASFATDSPVIGPSAGLVPGDALPQQTCAWVNTTPSSPNPVQQTQPVAGGVGSGSISLKILVSNNIAGSIIGKSGESILKMQRSSKCRIKLSQSSECFPGTSDRVCLLTGDEIDSVKDAIGLILERFRDVREGQTNLPFGAVNSSQEEGNAKATITSLSASLGRTGSSKAAMYMIRILVPSPASGMLIGRGGSNVKAIADETNAKIQLAQKEDTASVATSERIVTMTGSLESCKACICKVLHAMASHPEVSQYSNMTTSYSKTGSSSVTRSTPSQTGNFPAAGSQRQGPTPSPLHPSAVSLGEMLPSSSTPGSHAAHRLAMSTHHLHGHVPPRYGLPLAVSGATPVTGTAADSYLASHYEPLQQGGLRTPGPANTIFFLSTNRSFASSAGGTGPVHVDASRLPSESLGNATGLSGSPVIPPQTSAVQPLLSSPPLHQGASIVEEDRIQSLQLAVPDSLVGMILGRGGCYLNDIQHRSGARIEVSQRGEFVPGTNNRIMTITGSAQACATAHFFISKKLAEHSSQSNT